MTTGSIGNLAAVELRRADRRERDKNGERVTTAPPVTDEIIDYTDDHHLGAEVTQDGPKSMMTQAQLASQGDGA